jgi:arsenate reductase
MPGQDVGQMKTVLFICVHNSGRSQMAAAFFNQMAQGKGKAISAGSKPADKVNPTVVKAMQEIGIDITQNKPKLLTLEMMEGIALAITMGCENACPLTTVETRDWALEDPKDKPIGQVRKIRDEIKDRVKKLIEEITPDQEA